MVEPPRAERKRDDHESRNSEGEPRRRRSYAIAQLHLRFPLGAMHPVDFRFFFRHRFPFPERDARSEVLKATFNLLEHFPFSFLPGERPGDCCAA